MFRRVTRAGPAPVRAVAQASKRANRQQSDRGIQDRRRQQTAMAQRKGIRRSSQGRASRVRRTIDEMVVDETGTLHEGIADDRTNVLESF